MEAVATVIVSLLNALAALLPQLPGLIDRIRESDGLTAEGKALLDRIDDRIAEHERKLAATDPLPVPDPKLTRPG
jgi:ribosomal protein S19E (S16A)